MEDKKKICVKVYFNEKSFTEVAGQAERAGKRRGGLQLFTQKKNGMPNELISNTDGISKFLKYCAKYYKDTETERFAKIQQLKLEQEKIAQEMTKYGVL